MGNDDTQRPTIYCSGPLFSPEERAAMQSLAHVFEQEGWQTFLPQRDGLEPYILPLAAMAGGGDATGLKRRVERTIFALDVYCLVDVSSGVVCNLNGRVPDEGMIVEAALAAAAGKPLVFYKDDVRGVFGGRDNAMLTALAEPASTRLDRVVPAMKKALASAPAVVETLSPRIEAARRLGRKVDSFLGALGRPGARGGDDVLAELVRFIESETAESERAD